MPQQVNEGTPMAQDNATYDPHWRSVVKAVGPDQARRLGRDRLRRVPGRDHTRHFAPH